jgi:putative flippase GtrA
MQDGIPTISLGRQLMRAVLASNSGALTDFALLAFFVEMAGLPSILASMLSFSFATVLVYILNVRWVFTVRRFENRSAEFSLFTGISLVALVFNTGSMWLCIDLLSMHYLLAKVLAGAVVFFFNFTARKLILFSSIRDVPRNTITLNE